MPPAEVTSPGVSRPVTLQGLSHPCPRGRAPPAQENLTQEVTAAGIPPAPGGQGRHRRPEPVLGQESAF